MHGGMVTLRLHNTCWLSSYLVDLRKKDKKPEGSLLLSLTWERSGYTMNMWRYRQLFVHTYYILAKHGFLFWVIKLIFLVALYFHGPFLHIMLTISKVAPTCQPILIRVLVESVCLISVNTIGPRLKKSSENVNLFSNALMYASFDQW